MTLETEFSAPPLVVLHRHDGSPWQLVFAADGIAELAGLPCRAWVSVQGGALKLTIEQPARLWAPGLQKGKRDARIHDAGKLAGTAKVPQREVLRLGKHELVAFHERGDRAMRPLPEAVQRLVAEVRRADTATTREVLADALEEQGSPAEAEYVRRELALQHAKDTKSQAFTDELERFKALGQVVGTTFRYVVGRDVEGCAGLRWTFRCPRTFGELTETGSSSTRFCEACHSPVVRADTEAEAGALAARGVCVSYQAPDEQLQWVGDMAVPAEPRGPPSWVGSVAMPHPRIALPDAPKPEPAVEPKRSLMERVRRWFR